MARNRIQFQKGYSLVQFMDEYGTEEQCREALFRWRWPNGFVCPRCEHTGHCLVHQPAAGSHHVCVWGIQAPDAKTAVRLADELVGPLGGWRSGGKCAQPWMERVSAKPGRVTVPHPNKDIPRGTVVSIYHQAGWSR